MKHLEARRRSCACSECNTGWQGSRRHPHRKAAFTAVLQGMSSAKAGLIARCSPISSLSTHNAGACGPHMGKNQESLRSLELRTESAIVWNSLSCICGSEAIAQGGTGRAKRRAPRLDNALLPSACPGRHRDVGPPVLLPNASLIKNVWQSGATTRLETTYAQAAMQDSGNATLIKSRHSTTSALQLRGSKCESWGGRGSPLAFLSGRRRHPLRPSANVGLNARAIPPQDGQVLVEQSHQR